MRVLRWFALLALLAVPAWGQDAAPTPAPLPLFHAPAATGIEAGTSDSPTDTSVDATEAAAPVDAEPVEEAPAPPPEPVVPTVTTPQPVVLTALSRDGGPAISEGLVWRVFAARPGSNGDLPLTAKTTDASPHLSLPPGDYVIHLAYGRAQTSETLQVKEGENDKSIVLEAGGLRLNAAVTGDVPIPINLLRFDVFTAGQSDADRALVAQGLGANNILTVNAGTYHVVSYFGDVNAVVRADLRVEPGQLTDATLYHKASQVSLKLVSEQGGEAIADVDWTVKARGGDTVFTDTGTFPATVLAAGDYTVLAKRGDKVYNRDFSVLPGQPHEIEVLTTVY